MPTVLFVVATLYVVMLYIGTCALLVRDLAEAKGYPSDLPTLLLGIVLGIFAVMYFHLAPARNGRTPAEVSRALLERRPRMRSMLGALSRYGFVAACVVLVVALVLGWLGVA